MEADVIQTTMSVEEVIEKISGATGNARLRIVAPLSGKVKENKFRVSLPPGFSNPLTPILIGEIVQNENGSVINYSFVKPWLGILALFVAWIILQNISWPNMTRAIGSTACVFFVGALLFYMRESEKKELVSILAKLLKSKCI